MLSALKNLFFPTLCAACQDTLGGGENIICTNCRHQLPETQFHRYNDKAVQKVFYGRLPITQGTALFYFEKKGPVQQLLHRLKYKGQKNISEFLGDWLGEELAQDHLYTTIDVVIPVPLHPKKKRSRGYNQVTGFAKALSSHLECSFRDDVLLKSKNTKTQVFKGRMTRSDEVFEAFYIRPDTNLSGKHILLVDDILTTGATLEACGLELLKIPNVELSIATMAIAT
ncbi:MAG: ComF family protein [Dokdonia sp.]|jgi:ComF family protein|nr:amidophosphoribosyltransferase [Cytophagaceae bacterium]